MHPDPIYLDYNATSPLSQSVTNWLKSGDLLFANPSSQHTLGKTSRKSINAASASLLTTFGRSEADTRLLYQSGATEAFTAITHSFSEWARQTGKELLVCFSRIDHPSVTSLAEQYWGPHVKFHELRRSRDLGYQHAENVEFLKDRKENNPELFILYHHLWVHNETGFVSPLKELAELKLIPDLFIHVDAVQAPGKIEDWNSLPEGDLWTFSGHKFGALKGIGFTLMKKAIPYYPLFKGGGQQLGTRGGTENEMGIRSLRLALEDLLLIDIAKNRRRFEEWKTFLQRELEGKGDVLLSPAQSTNTLYFYLSDLSSDVSLALFDLHGLALSAGSACSTGTAKASLVLQQKGLSAVERNGLRVSLPFQYDERFVTEVRERFSKALKKVGTSRP